MTTDSGQPGPFGSTILANLVTHQTPCRLVVLVLVSVTIGGCLGQMDGRTP